MNYDVEGNEDAFMDVALYKGVQWAFCYEDMEMCSGMDFNPLVSACCDHDYSGNSRNALADIWLLLR